MDLTEAQWQVLKRCSLPSDVPMVAVGPGAMREQCATEFSGSYAPALLGTIWKGSFCKGFKNN